MKLLFDENLPPALARAVQVQFPGSLHVHDLGLGARDDSIIWDYAREHGCIVATKDSDFEQRIVLLGAPPKVIWLRTGNCTTSHLVSLLSVHAGQIEAFAASATDAVLEIG